MVIIGDVHGNLKTLKALIAQLPKDANIILTGDLIDRGPDSKGVIDFVMNNPRIRCVKGNHEDFLIDVLDDKPYAMAGWLSNGGRQTLYSYQCYQTVNPYGKQGQGVVMEIPEEHEKFIRNLPDYIETDELIISHTADIRDKWTRSFNVFPQNTEKFHVFGHTPLKKIIIKRNYACIDTGCFYLSKPGFGKLTAFQYPQRRIWQQENIDVD